MNGSGYASSLTAVSGYDIYVVTDVAWSDGMPISGRVPGTVTIVTPYASGNISPTAVWLSPLAQEDTILWLT